MSKHSAIEYRQPAFQHTLFVRISDLVFFALILMLFLDGADAYAFAGVPLQWIGFSIGIPLVVLYSAFSRLQGPPGTIVYLILLTWLLGNTAFGVLAENYADLMPIDATTSYPIFVLLRIYTFIAFITLLIVIYNLLEKGKADVIANAVVFSGVIVTIYAFYILAAQKLGLPQPAKLRYGTGIGGAQSGGEEGYFSNEGGGAYLFRLIGSFREPSTMAVWLITPFFVSFVGPRRTMRWPTLTIGLGLLGTGSLTTAISIPIGFFLAFLLTGSFDRRTFFIILGLIIGTFFVVGAVDIVVKVIFDSQVTFIDQFLSRINLILNHGILKTNRGYVFENFIESPFSFYGYGLGNAHIMNSKGSVIVSFLNLYFHIWFAGGAFGMLLIIFYLMLPFYLVLMQRKAVFSSGAFWYLAAYITWLTTFLVSSEAFCLMFTVAMAGLLYGLKQRKI